MSEHEVVMLRRAAEACRNARKQMGGRTDWFAWVPEWLDGLAAHIEHPDLAKGSTDE